MTTAVAFGGLNMVDVFDWFCTNGCGEGRTVDEIKARICPRLKANTLAARLDGLVQDCPMLWSCRENMDGRWVPRMPARLLLDVIFHVSL